MIVDTALYRRGIRVDLAAPVKEFQRFRAAATEPGDFVWVGLHQPDETELGEVAEAFGLHRLAVEDAVTAHQRPKLEQYDNGLFMVLRTLWYVDAEDAVETGEISLFIGTDFVITVRHGRGSELRTARARLESHEAVLTHGPSAVVYAVCDSVVDGYVGVLGELEVDVDEVEEAVFATARTDVSARIYTLKRETAEVRRALLPVREPMRRFASGSVPGIEEAAAPFFRDISDHLAQGADVLETLDNMLSSAFEAHLTRISVQQNEDMRKISAAVGLVAAPTLIAAVYGMNFHLTPSPNSVFGFWFALVLMAVSVTGLWVWFKRSGWF